MNQSKQEEAERGTHLSHCYQGEYESSCKYLQSDCPAKPESQSQGELSVSFSPGPWEVVQGAYNLASDLSVWPIDASPARKGGGDGDKRIACWIRTPANAQLIASAPALYAALKAVCEFLNVTPIRGDVGDSITVSMLVDAARAAIALAEKGSQQ